MNFEIDLPSLGTSLGCLCINYDVRASCDGIPSNFFFRIQIYSFLFWSVAEWRIPAVDTTLRDRGQHQISTIEIDCRTHDERIQLAYATLTQHTNVFWAVSLQSLSQSTVGSNCNFFLVVIHWQHSINANRQRYTDHLIYQRKRPSVESIHAASDLSAWRNQSKSNAGGNSCSRCNLWWQSEQ